MCNQLGDNLDSEVQSFTNVFEFANSLRDVYLSE